MPLDEHEDNESLDIRQVRGRVHKLADMVQTHEGTLIEHRTLIPRLSKELDALRAEAATREGLTAAISTLQIKMDSNSREYTLKLDNIQASVSAIQKGINWGVGIIVAAVMMAVLALVLKP